MGRDRKTKHKLSRREGRDLFGTSGPSLERRLQQPPGMHVRRPGRRQSETMRQLCEKQKVKRIYGLREGPFRRFFRMALRSREPTGLALSKLLERRLDNVIYRLGFARSRPQARQFANRGHVDVDGQRVDVPSYLVEPGQVVALEEAARWAPDVRDLAAHRPPLPGWLERRDGAGRILREPARATLETLGQRLAGGEAGDLAAQLPAEVGHYLQQTTDGERFGVDELIRRVSREEGVDLPNAIYHARAVISVLREAVSPGEMDHVRAQLPEAFDPLFDSGSEGEMRMK